MLAALLIVLSAGAHPPRQVHAAHATQPTTGEAAQLNLADVAQPTVGNSSAERHNGMANHHIGFITAAAGGGVVSRRRLAEGCEDAAECRERERLALRATAVGGSGWPPSWIGSDSAAEACVDDPTGLIAEAGYQCALVRSLLGCSADLHDVSPLVPVGTFVESQCPVSCDACPETEGSTSGPCDPPRWFGVRCTDDGFVKAIYLNNAEDSPLTSGVITGWSVLRHIEIIDLWGRGGSVGSIGRSVGSITGDIGGVSPVPPVFSACTVCSESSSLNL